jgi:hypothetical protein
MSHQLSSAKTDAAFGEINVSKGRDRIEVSFTVLMEPAGEGWQTGVALDGSSSMRQAYGRLLLGGPSSEVVESYKRKGLVHTQVQDGHELLLWDDAALQEMIHAGIFKHSENIVQQPAREFTAYLAGRLDADGGTTVIYWACGGGEQLEVIGDFTEEQCKLAEFKGPQAAKFGNSTMLLPAMKYFADRFHDAENGMYVFITDGELNDMAAVKSYTVELCRDIEAGRRKPLKCVLIGLGDQINEAQMEELDDLESGTTVDLWDHKIAKDMRSIKDIFAELISDQAVAPEAKILDSKGRVVKQFTDGMPAKVTFTMPPDSTFFTLEVGGQTIKQTIQ